VGGAVVLNRLPLPSQFDRVIITGTTIAGAIAAPFLVALVVLLAADQITGPEFVFWLLAAVIVTSALGAVLMRNVVHAALSLVITALGIAALFLLLASEFLALVQVLVYGGGVTILLLFGLMLTNAQDDPLVTDGSQKPFAFGVGIALGAVISIAMMDADWNATERSAVAFQALGERLFRDFGVPFEVASLVLLVALVGAIAIARRHQDEEEDLA
jgi:NADH-quinone oxidoreductase subunit J